MKSRRFIALPHFALLSNYNLQYKDVLTYIAIRSFDNSDNECFPSYETIGRTMGAGRKFVMQSISRLEKANHINVVRSTKEHISNNYYFEKIVAFERIPYDIFDTADLTVNERAMLLCLRQFFYCKSLQCPFNIVKLAELLGVTYNTLVKQFKSLVDKGYISERVKKNRFGYYRLTDKVNWLFDVKDNSINYSSMFIMAA